MRKKNSQGTPRWCFEVLSITWWLPVLVFELPGGVMFVMGGNMAALRYTLFRLVIFKPICLGLWTVFAV